MGTTPNILPTLRPEVVDEINAFNAILGNKKITYKGEEKYIDCGKLAGYVYCKVTHKKIPNNYDYYIYQDYLVKYNDCLKFIRDNFSDKYMNKIIKSVKQSYADDKKFDLYDLNYIFHDLEETSGEFKQTPVSNGYFHITFEKFRKYLKPNAPGFCVQPVVNEVPKEVVAPEPEVAREPEHITSHHI